MPINIYSVTNHLNSEGWTLISNTYKNLQTELEMKCPNGHLQTRTYGDWRKHPTCDMCFGGSAKKIKKNIVPIKKIDTQRILALDAATNITGYAIFDDGELVSFGTFKTNVDKNTEERIHQVKTWLQSMIRTCEPSFVGIEHIQLQVHGYAQNVETYRVLANLQGVLLDTLFEECIDHDLAYASEWRKYCNINTEKGRENKKKIAQEKIKQWYGQDCTQDEADAICIGKYFVGKLKNNKSSNWGEDIE